MKTTTTWLLAGAALTLIAGTSVAIAADAKDQAKDAPKTERREIHIYRQNGEERIVIDKDGEHREFIAEPGRAQRFELRRDGDGAIMMHGGAGRAEHMKALLQLRPDQEPALRAFIDAARPSGDRMGRRGEREDFRALSTPERLDRARARMVERMAAFDRRAAATKRFYAQLSPSQQKAFDAIGPRGGPGGRGDHHGGGGFRHGPDGPHD